MKIKKKILPLLLSAALVLSLMPSVTLPAFAASDAASYSFDISEGNITISSGSGSGMFFTPLILSCPTQSRAPHAAGSSQEQIPSVASRTSPWEFLNRLCERRFRKGSVHNKWKGPCPICSNDAAPVSPAFRSQARGRCWRRYNTAARVRRRPPA